MIDEVCDTDISVTASMYRPRYQPLVGTGGVVQSEGYQTELEVSSIGVMKALFGLAESSMGFSSIHF